MKERIVAAGILAFALAYAAGSLALKVGTLAQPGAGQFPAAIAFALLAVSGVHAWRTFRNDAREEKGHAWARLAPAGIAATLVVYPLLLRSLSFLLSTCIVLFVLFRLLGFKRSLTSLAAAAVTTVLSFVVFAGLLGVVLPSGAAEGSILRLLGISG
jgi:putative tricarboxylic transport membrane protein